MDFYHGKRYAYVKNSFLDFIGRECYSLKGGSYDIKDLHRINHRWIGWACPELSEPGHREHLSHYLQPLCQHPAGCGGGVRMGLRLRLNHDKEEGRMDKKERLNALEVALNNEMREREFYLKNAERTKDSLGKKMFQQIGDDELEHYERLKQLKDKWVKQEKWPDTVPLKVKETIVKDILVDFIKKVDQSGKSDSSDLEAVRIAIDFEAKGAKFYAEIRDASSDSKEKGFFDLLSKIEHEHYLSLKDTEEYFIDPASWYRKMEHHTLDGA
jgi:rubrerythrin